MSQPPAYNPVTSFVTYQAQQAWFPGQQLDVEFNAVSTSMAAIERDLALIQKDDGTLASALVDWPQIAPTLQQYLLNQGFVPPTQPVDYAAAAWTQLGTGAVARTIKTKLYEVVSVLDYGADPTGATDSATAFQKAVTYVATTGGGTTPGGMIYIPPGKYLLNSTVTIASSNIRIRGAGSASLIVNGQAAAPAIQFGDGTNTYFRCGIENVAFGQSGSVVSSAGNIALNVQKQGTFTLKNVTVFEFPGAPYNGIVLNGVSQSYISDVDITACQLVGLTALTCSSLYMTNIETNSNGSLGFLFTDCAGVYLDSCASQFNLGFGWELIAASAHNVNFFFRNALGDTNGSYNWFITDLSESTFLDCWGATQLSPAVNTGAAGFFLAGSAVHDVKFIGGHALLNNGTGVQIANIAGMPTNLQFVGFTFGNALHPNGRAGTGYGLSIDSAATTISVKGGQALSNATAQVVIGASANAVTIEGLVGYNPVGASALSPGSSPWTYTAGSSPETVYLSDSSGITALTQGGVSILPHATAANAPLSVSLGPNEAAVITFGGTLTAKKMVH